MVFDERKLSRSSNVVCSRKVATNDLQGFPQHSIRMSEFQDGKEGAWTRLHVLLCTTLCTKM